MGKKRLKESVRQLTATCGGWRALYNDVCAELSGTKAELADAAYANNQMKARIETLTSECNYRGTELGRVKDEVERLTQANKQLNEKLDLGVYPDSKVRNTITKSRARKEKPEPTYSGGPESQ